MNTRATEQPSSALSGKSAILIAQSPTDSVGFRNCLREEGVKLLERGASQLGDLLKITRSTGVAFVLFDCEAHAEALIEVRRLRQVPDCPVFYASHHHHSNAALAEQHGARILRKPCERHQFIHTIESGLDAELPSLPALTRVAVRQWGLSPQQARVLFFNLWSFTNEEIARAMGLSLNTVLDYQNTLRRKTGARSKDGYLRRILEFNGVCPPPLDLGDDPCS